MNPLLAEILPAPLALDSRALEALQELASNQHAIANARALYDAAGRAGGASAGGTVHVEVVDRVARITIDGMLVAKRTWLSDLLGASVLSEVEAAILEAAGDATIAAILLSIDSPGGSVRGTPEVVQAVRAARQRKPVAVHSAGMLASGAYWIASPADLIGVGPVSIVGSIGVVATHVDVSGAEQQRGIRTTEVVAGKFKRITSAYGPLSAEGLATLQDQVDHVYSMFVADIAESRAAPLATVLDRMADGRLFVGQQAADAGLVDCVSSLGAVQTHLQRLIGG